MLCIFSNELVDVDRVKCFDHVEGGEDCPMRVFLLKPVSMVLLIWCRAVAWSVQL